jgi:hypothetical protein
MTRAADKSRPPLPTINQTTFFDYDTTSTVHLEAKQKRERTWGLKLWAKVQVAVAHRVPLPEFRRIRNPATVHALSPLSTP